MRFLFENVFSACFLLNNYIDLVKPEKIEIDYRLSWSVVELFYNFVENESFTDSLLQHGCWCAKLNPGNSVRSGLGGPFFEDDLDSICKQWARARHCSKVEDQVCEGFGGRWSYEIIIEKSKTFINGY